MELAFGIIATIGICVLIALQFRNKGTGANSAEYERLQAEIERRDEQIVDLKTKIETEKKEKNELSGKGKQLYDSFKNMESDLKVLRNERDALQSRVKEFEADEKRREKEFSTQLEKLEAAKKGLEDERKRVIHEDEERLRLEAEARDRLWADHENAVIAAMTDLCKLPTLAFTGYTNTNLPDGFDGSLKPDFMIDFLGQYVIFDAKISKAKSLKTYIDDQIKKTVEKVKDNDKIYKSIFLVVPASALTELKKHHYEVDGYSLFVVPPEALAPILASFKRISLYEFAEQMDPQQRENIVQLIAELDFHINLRNAADIILSKMGTDLLSKAQRMDPALAEEVALKKAPMNAKASIAAGDLKKIVSKLTAQAEEIRGLVSPSAPVRSKDLTQAETILSDSLFGE